MLSWWYCSSTHPGQLLYSVQSWSQSSDLLPWLKMQAVRWARGCRASQFFFHLLQRVRAPQLPNSLEPKKEDLIKPDDRNKQNKLQGFFSFSKWLITFAGYSPWKFPPEMVSALSANTIFKEKLGSKHEWNTCQISVTNQNILTEGMFALIGFYLEAHYITSACSLFRKWRPNLSSPIFSNRLYKMRSLIRGREGCKETHVFGS